MKKILLIALIIGLLIVGVLIFNNKNIITNNHSENNKNFHPDPSGATFIIDNEQVTLRDQTFLTDKIAYGDINADNKEDAIIIIAHSGGGSGLFIYLAAYVSGPVTYHGTEATYIGDRISPQSLIIKNGVVIFEYLDRKFDEPFAAEPTISMEKKFIFQDGEFQEK